MPEAMTKERLEELQEMAADAIDAPFEEEYGEALSEACSEIERLMAENRFIWTEAIRLQRDHLNSLSDAGYFAYISRHESLNAPKWMSDSWKGIA